MRFKEPFDPSRYLNKNSNRNTDKQSTKPTSGRHLAVIKQITLEPSKSGNGRNFKILYSEITGKWSIRQYIVATNENTVAVRIGREKFAKLIRASGIVGTIQDTDEMLNRRLELDITINRSGYPEVKETYRMEDQNQTAQDDYDNFDDEIPF